MKKLFMRQFNLFLIILLFNGCQSVKDGLTGQKKGNSDEFLIEKKSPLVLPPEFSELPQPEMLNTEKDTEDEIDIKKLITNKSGDTKIISNDSNGSMALEKSILKKIRKN